ncbi:hypothetical protein RFI_29136, partial [Reticulomyxa filosa]
KNEEEGGGDHEDKKEEKETLQQEEKEGSLNWKQDISREEYEQIMDMVLKDVNMFENYVTPIVWSAIQRLYAPNPKIVECLKVGLERNPLATLSVLLPRLEERQAEWKRERQRARTTVRFQTNFKTQDRKQTNPRHLWNELISAQCQINPHISAELRKHYQFRRNKSAEWMEDKKYKQCELYSPIASPSTLTPSCLHILPRFCRTYQKIVAHLGAAHLFPYSKHDQKTLVMARGPTMTTTTTTTTTTTANRGDHADERDDDDGNNDDNDNDNDNSNDADYDVSIHDLTSHDNNDCDYNDNHGNDDERGNDNDNDNDNNNDNNNAMRNNGHNENDNKTRSPHNKCRKQMQCSRKYVKVNEIGNCYFNFAMRMDMKDIGPEDTHEHCWNLLSDYMSIHLPDQQQHVTIFLMLTIIQHIQIHSFVCVLHAINMSLNYNTSFPESKYAFITPMHSNTNKEATPPIDSSINIVNIHSNGTANANIQTSINENEIQSISINSNAN